MREGATQPSVSSWTFPEEKRSGPTINEASAGDPFQRGYLVGREDHHPVVYSGCSVKEIHQLFTQILYRMDTGKRRVGDG